MNEVGSGDRKREPFFFEQAGGHVIPSATAEAINAKAERHHWKH